MNVRTKTQTQLELLSTLEEGDVITQMDMAKRLSVSVGLVNALLKRVVQKGLVKARAAPCKRWSYYLTPRGFAEKSRLVAEYLEVSLDFFRAARLEYATLFSRAYACGVRRVVLVGRGELVEIAFLAAREANLEIVGLLDREVNVTHLYGLSVLRDLKEVDGDTALVLTATRTPQRVYDQVKLVCARRMFLLPGFLHVTRDRGHSIP